MQKKKYIGKSIIKERNKFPLLYDYLKTLHINLKNIYITVLPQAIVYYTMNNDLYSENVELKYKELKNIRNHLKYSTVYIFPEEDLYDDNKVNKYEDFLRIFLTEDDNDIKGKLRKDKLKRLL